MTGLRAVEGASSRALPLLIGEDMAREIYKAKSSFVADVDGIQITVKKGDTVRGGHPVIKGRESLFEPFTVRFENTSAPRGRRQEDD